MAFSLTIRDAAARLAATKLRRRRRMAAYRRTFKQALAAVPASGSWASVYTTATTMLDILEQHIASGDAPLALRRALSDIVIFERLNADMAAFQTHFGLTDDEMDAIFEAARTFE